MDVACAGTEVAADEFEWSEDVDVPGYRHSGTQVSVLHARINVYALS